MTRDCDCDEHWTCPEHRPGGLTYETEKRARRDAKRLEVERMLCESLNSFVGPEFTDEQKKKLEEVVAKTLVELHKATTLENTHVHSMMAVGSSRVHTIVRQGTPRREHEHFAKVISIRKHKP